MTAQITQNSQDHQLHCVVVCHAHWMHSVTQVVTHSRHCVISAEPHSAQRVYVSEKLVVQFDGIGFHVPFWKLPLLIVIFAFLSSPLSYFLRLRVRKRRGTRGEIVLRLIQIRLATSSLERISPACQANSPRPRIADSSSTNAVSFSSARTRGPRRDHSSTLNNCSTSGIVVNAPTATSVQPIARLCSAVSFSESNSAMPAPSICTRAGDETDLRNGDFVLFHVSFDSF